MTVLGTMRAAFLIIVLTRAAYAAGLSNVLIGTWVITSPPDSVANVKINDVDGILHAFMPRFYGALLSPSDGVSGSDLLLSGSIGDSSYECYYRLTVLNPNTIVWDLRRGDSACYKNFVLRRAP